MHQTLFRIPNQLFGLPVFGFGLLLAVWAVLGIGTFVWVGRRQGFRHPDTLNYIPLLAILGLAIWYIPPMIKDDLGIPIRGYGVLLLTAIVAGAGLSVWRARQRGLDADHVLSIVLWGVVPGIVGARAFYVIEYWDRFHRDTLGQTLGAIVNITEGGIVVYGSLIGALLGFGYYAWKQKMRLLAVLDLLTPGMLLGLSIGRIGCLLNGCCYGGLCEHPWAVHFPAGTPPYAHQVEHHQIPYPEREALVQGETYLNGLKLPTNPLAPPVIVDVEPGSPAEAAGMQPGQTIARINKRAPVEMVRKNGKEVAIPRAGIAQELLWQTYGQGSEIVVVTDDGFVAGWPLTGPPPATLGVHPTQLYSAIDALVICLFLLAWDPFRRRDGELLALFLTIYPITRFLMEMIRTDEPKWQVGPLALTIGQIVSLCLFALAAGLWTYLVTRPRGVANHL